MGRRNRKVKNEISNRRPDINLNDVEKGDVLLSCGRGELSHAIRLLDGGDYSHAAICVNIDERDGPKIVESTRKGVVENPLAPDVSGQEYVDVYRFIGDTGERFGSAEWPHEPVIDRAHFYKDQKTQYAFNQLYLMSVLIMVRRAPLGKLGRANIRYWLDRMIRFFRDVAADQKEQVTCSEMVYRCYFEAESAPRGKFGLTIRGTLDSMGMLVKAFAPNSSAVYPELDRESRELLAEAEGLFWQLQYSASEGGFRSKAANPNVCGNMVTPRDLQMSLNLELMGRLRG
jgi:hypothetical protein